MSEYGKSKTDPLGMRTWKEKFIEEECRADETMLAAIAMIYPDYRKGCEELASIYGLDIAQGEVNIRSRVADAKRFTEGKLNGSK